MTMDNGFEVNATEQNAAIIELSEDELDNIAGGLSLNLGDIGNFAQSSSNFFEETNLGVQQGTFAGRDGSGTFSTVLFNQVKSGASQDISIG